MATGAATGHYIACTTAANYQVLASTPGFTPSVTKILYWAGSAWSTSCPSPDSGLQQLTLQVASSDGRASEQLVIVVRKP